MPYTIREAQDVEAPERLLARVVRVVRRASVEGSLSAARWVGRGWLDVMSGDATAPGPGTGEPGVPATWHSAASRGDARLVRLTNVEAVLEMRGSAIEPGTHLDVIVDPPAEAGSEGVHMTLDVTACVPLGDRTRVVARVIVVDELPGSTGFRWLLDSL